MLYRGMSAVGQLIPIRDTSLLGHPGCLSPSLHSCTATAPSDDPVASGQPQASMLLPPNLLHDFRESVLSTLILFPLIFFISLPGTAQK